MVSQKLTLRKGTATSVLTDSCPLSVSLAHGIEATVLALVLAHLVLALACFQKY
jgi:hypothetical protein